MNGTKKAAVVNHVKRKAWCRYCSYCWDPTPGIGRPWNTQNNRRIGERTHHGAPVGNRKQVVVASRDVVQGARICALACDRVERRVQEPDSVSRSEEHTSELQS